MVAIAVAIITVIFATAYKNQDILKAAIISGSIGGTLILAILIFFLIDRHNCSIFLKGEKLEFVIKKFYYDESNEQVGYDFELLTEPGVTYHRNTTVLFYGLEPDLIHGYAYALDNNLEVDDDSLFKMIPESNNTWNEENNEEEMYQNEPTDEDLESPMSEESKESPQQEDTQLDSNQVQRDYHEDVIIVDDDPTERKNEDPVEKIVDQDGDDDWSRAI